MKKGIWFSRIVALLTAVMVLSAFGSMLLSPVISKFVKPLDEGECDECHNGFEPYELTIDSPEEVPVDHEFEFRIRVENNWKHDIDSIVMWVDDSNHPGISPVEEIPGFMESSFTGSVNRFQTQEHPFDGGPISPDKLTVSLEGDDGLFGFNNLDMEIEDSTGNIWTSDGPDADEEIVIEDGGISGSYTVKIIHVMGRGTISYTLSLSAVYRETGAMIFDSISSISPGEKGELAVSLISTELSKGSLKVYIESEVSYDHRDGMRSEMYTEEMSYEIVVGDELIYHPPKDKMSASEMMWVTGRVLGFLTAALFFLSFFTGGSINSVKQWLDRRMKRRKEWHCVIAFTTVISAIVHMIILYSGIYSNTYKGLGLGMTATIFMFLIGVSGMFRRKLISRFGEKKWRRFHFWLSIAVIMIFVIHAVKEGTDLAFLRWW
ncbi:MAG: ferric reductase-like transmembrane domain-containing protein [Thermoplasmatota archaeon]